MSSSPERSSPPKNVTNRDAIITEAVEAITALGEMTFSQLRPFLKSGTVHSDGTLRYVLRSTHEISIRVRKAVGANYGSTRENVYSLKQAEGE